MGWRRTKHPGVFVRHRKGCPAAADERARCRCQPSYRGKRRHPATGKPEWSRTYRERAEALTWLSAGEKALPAVREHAAAGPTFGALADEWWAGVQAGTIGKRRGDRGYSPTTLAGYDRSLRYVLKDEFGHRPAAAIAPADWQAFVDRLARQGLKRSTIANHLAVVRAIYGWASRPTRALVAGNPTLGIELPPVDERKRDRVAHAEEAAQLLEALRPDDQVPYALGFYAGLRRGEMHRLEWPDVDLEGEWLVVRKSKSDAGTNRGLPIAAPLRPILRAAFLRQGRPRAGRVLGRVSVMSGRLAPRARRAWEEAEKKARKRGVELKLQPIGLHETRHTYASFLMAAGYTLRELMEYMGHSSLQATERYVKLLPQPGRGKPAERLNEYLRKATTRA
jgi:integrase